METQNHWWAVPTYEQPTVCAYCGSETSPEEDLEHILPESLGCVFTLYAGAVCVGCNRQLGNNVDQFFLEEPLVAAGQLASNSPGKRGVRQEIQIGKSKKQGDVTSMGGVSGSQNEFVVGRAIAKCGINIFTHYFGSEVVFQNLKEIIAYVRQPKNRNDVWPFAAIYTPTATPTVSFKTGTYKNSYSMFMFTCASGLFASVADRTLQNAGAAMINLLKKELADLEAAKGEKLVNKFEYWTKEPIAK